MPVERLLAKLRNHGRGLDILNVGMNGLDLDLVGDRGRVSIQEPTNAVSGLYLQEVRGNEEVLS